MSATRASATLRRGPLGGAGYLGRGFALWRHRPGLMLLGMVPALLVAQLMAVLLVGLVLVADDVVAWATPFADGWDDTVRDLVRLALYLLVLAGSGFLVMITFTGLTLAVGDPFYERIWAEVERMLGGDAPTHGVGWWRGIKDGGVLIGFGFLTAGFVFLVGLLPVVGSIVGAVLGLVMAGRLLAGELISRPLEARGMDRAAQAALLRGHRGAVLGFGVAVQACFLVPLGGVLVMPAAVAGATMLARDVLDAQPR
ncbi:EI24 domain-containing protein [Nocardioides sambongensis]|uniref:EI24 domain-containing protein n=1 Tax=Nocardioides sambongensis TaxID=2589074 RepID=UPI00112B9D61|nr:EI24 domain-containing protein [Nocardioides sambongensis]